MVDAHELGDLASILAEGEMEVLGRLPDSSNATLLVRIARPGSELGRLRQPTPDDDERAAATGRLVGLPVLGPDEVFGVYKPLAGEQPLWDFPPGLHRREVAAHRLADHLGWPEIPPTVLRDGPAGEGSVQAFLDVDQRCHFFEFRDDQRFRASIRRLCVLDHVMNNTDRKAGHCLAGDDHVWGIDNGLTFHAEYKLRTVLWDEAGDAIDDELLAPLSALAGGDIPKGVAELLDALEREALVTRARAITVHARFPTDPTGRRVPWPLI